MSKEDISIINIIYNINEELENINKILKYLAHNL